MKLKGDPLGIDELKKMRESNPDFLKFVLKEASTNTDLKTTFKSPNGDRYQVSFNPKTFEFLIEKI